MRILIASDKFRGTLTARQAVEAFATGWRRERPSDDIDPAPMADGGEGTMPALVDALDGVVGMIRVSGPLGDPVDAGFGLVDLPDGRTGVVEMALASGLQLVSAGRRNPLRTSTRGTGELIRRVLDEDVRGLIVCVGGSATNDGGAGMAQALGVLLLDVAGQDIEPGGAGLVSLARIDISGRDPRLSPVSILVASDVNNPLTGPSGASAVFGPQKGATPDDVLFLDRALGHLAAIVGRDLGVDLRDEPGAGAAGGLGFGLMAFLGARIRSGFDVVSEAVGLPARVERADLVVTGEGRFDSQSVRGKVPAGVLRMADEHAVPAVVVCGDVEPGVTWEDVPLFSLVDRFGRAAALTDARRSLERLAQELAERAEDLVGGRG